MSPNPSLREKIANIISNAIEEYEETSVDSNEVAGQILDLVRKEMPEKIGLFDLPKGWGVSKKITWNKAVDTMRERLGKC